MNQSAKTVKAECTQCKGPTQHEVICSHSAHSGPDDDCWWRSDFQVVRCMGCQHTCFRRSDFCSEYTDNEGQPTEDVTIFPVPYFRQPAVDPLTLPAAVSRVYQETFLAFGVGADALAAAGLRTVVEAICKDQKCQGDNLQKSIEKLVTKGVLLKRDADYLHQHRFLGNEAVHEMRPPPKNEFMMALQILEHLLTTIYVMPNLDANLRRLRDARKKKP